MIRTFNDLRERPIHAVDGELGKVGDLYFDDRSWHVRYMVAELGSWFKSKRVLISPLALGEFDGVALKVHLTKQEIAECPDTEKDKPVYLQEKERTEALYTMVQSYNPAAGLGMVLPFVPPVNGDELHIGGRWNRHLRSSRIVTQYTLNNEEGKIGLVRDFVIDDRSWIIRYVVFSPAGRAHHEERLLESRPVASIEWGEERMTLETSSLDLSQCPVFDRDRHVNISNEELLHLLGSSPRSIRGGGPSGGAS
jgi:hypothetical protein